MAVYEKEHGIWLQRGTTFIYSIKYVIHVFLSHIHRK